MKKIIQKFFLVLLMACSVFCLPQSVYAQESQELSFVYGTNHYDGAVYSSAFIPPVVDTVYLLADHLSILASRLTDVYYWPITNEYRADWDTANIIVEGQLEILRGNTVIDTVQMTEYVIQYDGLNRMDTIQLYLGEEAVRARENFEGLQAQYREDLYLYYQDMNEYRQEFQAALADLQAGLITEDELPEPPEPLQDLTLFSTNLLWGFPINLSSGNYRIHLRTNDNEVIPESVKDLVIFEHQNEGIGYDVFSEERWSVPESAKNVNDVIYTLRDQIFFIEPYHQKQYVERYYVRMNNPQDSVSRVDRMIWVSHRPAENVSLSIGTTSGGFIETLENYFVQQLAGSRLGYEIIPFDPETMNQPSFTAFRIDLQAWSNLKGIALLDQDGKIIETSQRDIHILNTDLNWLVYPLAGLPILLGLFILSRRKRKVRDVKVVGVG